MLLLFITDKVPSIGSRFEWFLNIIALLTAGIFFQEQIHQQLKMVICHYTRPKNIALDFGNQ